MVAVTWAALAASQGCGGTPAAAPRDGGGSGGVAGRNGGAVGHGGAGGTTGAAGGGGGTSGSSGTTLSVSGSVLGAPFVAADIAANTNGSPPAGEFPLLELSVTDLADGACSDWTTGRADAHVLRLYIFNERDQTAIGPGVYQGSSDDGLLITDAFWHAFGPAVDGGCADENDLDQIYVVGAPTITLTEVSATRVLGSFDVTLSESGANATAGDAGVGHLSGTFSAPICPTRDGGVATCD
jgi:hypothetical protein